MDEKKEFLTEENYERGKKKVIIIALIILIVGILLGGSLIAIGIIKSNEVKKQNEQAVKQIEQNSKTRTASDVQADIDKIQSQIDQIDKEIASIQAERTKLINEQSKIFRDDKGFSDRYYAKSEQITKKENEISVKQGEKEKLQSSLSDYKTELWKINSGYNDTEKEIERAKNTMSTSKYIPFYMFGAFIIISSCMISGSIYIFAKRREITAFTAQQVMPIAQEGIEKMSPTIGNAAGSIAQGITKGIKNGLKDNDNNK